MTITIAAFESDSPVMHQARYRVEGIGGVMWTNIIGDVLECIGDALELFEIAEDEKAYFAIQEKS